MDKISIVTGGGTGIGQAISCKLAQNGHQVLIIGRREAKLLQTREKYPEKIDVLQADVSKEQDRLKIADKLSHKKIEFLVHNAAVLGEITKLEDIELKEWQRVMAINVEAPLFLTQVLIPRLENGRVLHVSSGAAHFAIKGWGAYCTSKASLFMIYKMLNAELEENNIKFGSLRPGIVDTEMQSFIRDADLNKMPHLQKFHDLYKNDEMESSERVAHFAYWILTKTSPADFAADEWDIRGDHTHLWDKR